jgi:hypothetical protein
MPDTDSTNEKTKWYQTTKTLVIALLCVGPFALPLLWFNPKFSSIQKILWTVVTLVATYFIVQMTMDSLTKIMDQYKALGL